MRRSRAAGRVRLILLCVSACLLPLVSAAQVAAAFNGTWVLDQDKSMFEPLATRPTRRIVTLQVKGNELAQKTETGRTRFLQVEPFEEASTTRVSYTAKFDGREYPVDNNNSNVTIKLKRINATTFERMATAGRATETSTWKLSADGKQLTVITQGVDAEGTSYTSTQVFEKQP